MGLETALRSRLLEDDGVAALAGTRVDWVSRRPGRRDEPAFPAVVLTVIYDPRPKTLGSRVRVRGTRVQFDCLALNDPATAALREAVLAAIEPAGTFFGVRFNRAGAAEIEDLSEDVEGTGMVHRDSIDVTIWHNG